MPGLLNPKKLSLHRQAAIALYRALLRQVRSLPFEPSERTQLQNITRNCFYHNRNLKSSRQIKIAFHAGYTALDVLDGSAAGDAQSTARITEYLSKVPERLKQPRVKHIQRGREWEHDDRDPPLEHKFLSVFPRPLGTVQGARKVPIMVDASGFPFLRWKKPQPHNLSRVLRQSIETRQKRVTRQWNLSEYWIPLAEYEDRWDGLMRALTVEEEKDDGEEREEGLYVTPMREELREVGRLMYEQTQRTKALVEKMQGIVDRETEIAAEEKRLRESIIGEEVQQT